MWALESPKIKPKLVRALDSIIDSFVSKPSKERLATRKEIYKKLDSDLAGKSAKGVWGARLTGIASVISIASLAEAADVSMTKADPDGKTGILRVSQGVFGGLKYLQDKTNERGGKANFNLLSEDKTSVQAARDNYFTDQTVTEFMGTGITTATQYIYLMMNEFFGVGPKTNIGDKKKSNGNGNKTVKAKPVASIPTRTKARVETKTHHTNKPARYAEKTKPVGRNYQDKARHASVEQTTEQSI